MTHAEAMTTPRSRATRLLEPRATAFPRRDATSPAARRRLVAAMVISVLTLAGGITAHAQDAVEITVDPEIVAPGATVTVTVTGAAASQPVEVRLGTEQATATTDETGGATVMVVAPSSTGEALGTVRIGAVDWPLRVVVQAPDETVQAPDETVQAPDEAAQEQDETVQEQDETATTTTTTVPPAPTTMPNTGLDDTATLVGLGAGLVAAGVGFVLLTRRTPAAVVTRGSVTEYRFAGGRRGTDRSRR